MDWKYITSPDDLDAIDARSQNQDVMIYKHSTRCGVCTTALGRIERKWSDNGIAAYFIDLLRYRNVSNAIAERYSVMHESPQVLLIRKGKCIYTTSHLSIDVDEIEKASSVN
jgi:bacillithiol system protein YtxJ